MLPHVTVRAARQAAAGKSVRSLVVSTETTVAVVSAATAVISAGVSVYTVVTQRRDARLKVHVSGNISTPVIGGQMTDPLFCITATHKGGPAITITGAGVLIAHGRRRRSNNGENFQVFWQHPLSSAMPGVLAPGGQELQYFFDLQDLLSEAAARSIPVTQLWPWVSLGNGDRVYGEHLHRNLAGFRRA